GYLGSRTVWRRLYLYASRKNIAIVIGSRRPVGQVETRNDQAFVAPALLPVLVSSKGMRAGVSEARACRRNPERSEGTRNILARAFFGFPRVAQDFACGLRRPHRGSTSPAEAGSE